MEYKRLTDEEIVKALDFCTVYEDCEECEYDDIAGCRSFLMRNALELIHRLQSENESLKKQIEELSKPRKKILANKVYSDSTLKKWKKEDLIEQIRILEHNWSCAEENLNNSVKNSEKIFYEQKAEIERLTIAEKQYLSEIERLNKSCGLFGIKLQEQIKETYDYVHKSDKLKKRNAELQKQVDELTKQREVGREKLKNEIANKIFMSASHGAIQCGKMSVAIAEIEAEKYIEFAWEMVQQAVKDTAKEIYGKIDKSDILVVQTQEYGEIEVVPMERLKEIIKSKGVEVE